MLLADVMFKFVHFLSVLHPHNGDTAKIYIRLVRHPLWMHLRQWLPVGSTSYVNTFHELNLNTMIIRALQITASCTGRRSLEVPTY